MDCQLLGNAIQRKCRFQVVACVSTAAEVVSAIRQMQPDVALISAQLQDGPDAGLSALRKLQVCQAKTRIVMLLDSDESEVVESFRQGALGVFNRNGSSQLLHKCIARVYEGQIWATNAHLKHVLEALAQYPKIVSIDSQNPHLLSCRQDEIARLAVAGLTNRGISERLNLNERTVKNHVSRIFVKLGVSSRVELILRYRGGRKPFRCKNRGPSP